MAKHSFLSTYNPTILRVEQDLLEFYETATGERRRELYDRIGTDLLLLWMTWEDQLAMPVRGRPARR